MAEPTSETLPGSAFLRWSLALVGTAILGWPGSAAGPAPPSTFDLEPEPRWVASLGWLAEGRELVLADPRSAALFVHDPQGRRGKKLAIGAGGSPLRGPFDLTPRPGGGWLLLDTPRRIVELAPDLTGLAEHALPQRGEEAGPWGPFLEIVGLEIQALSRDRWAVVADVSTAVGWASGLVELAPSAPRPAEWLVRLTEADEAWYLYRVNLRPSLAVVDGVAHWLRLDASPRIERLGAQPARIPLPPGFDKAPRPLGDLGGAERFPLLHARLRQQALPAGLFAHDGRLHLLTHAPARGEVAWSLWRLDGTEWRGPVLLPTPAGTRDLLVAPGRSSWAFLAKGAPSRADRQPLLGLFLLEGRALFFAR
jgi:hypothetical protein